MVEVEAEAHMVEVEAEAHMVEVGAHMVEVAERSFNLEFTRFSLGLSTWSR
jgi:hypothetical protein